MTVLERDAQLLRGFDHPVDDAQEAFRVLLNAMATPGRVMDLAGPKECPEGLSGPAAAVLLSLTDFSTALWIDPCLPYRDIESYVGFHAGARTTLDPAKSGFALIARNADEIDLGRFQSGTPEYPDRSTTMMRTPEQ